MSFARRAEFSPPIAYLEDWPYVRMDNFARLFGDSLYIRAYLTSIWNAAIATFLCLLLGYPMALGITRVSKSWRNVLLMLVILPFWTSFLLRVYAWMGLFGSNSWFNKGLTSIINLMLPDGMVLRSLPMMNSNFAVVLVMVYSYLPFMILPLYANLEKLDNTLNEAAMDLGSRPWQVFKDVTLPLSIPGIIAGGLLVFIPASGELIIPSLVGNASDPMIGRVISDEFSSARDWPMASAVAVALLMLLVLPMMVYSHFESRAQAAGDAAK
jgi:putrescine transport system permease protein